MDSVAADRVGGVGVAEAAFRIVVESWVPNAIPEATACWLTSGRVVAIQIRATSFTPTDHLPGGTYRFWVQAFNDNLEVTRRVCQAGRIERIRG